jgi:hypothetical protein
MRYRLIALLLALGACSASGTADAPQPGTLTLTLTTPATTDGAVVLVISGGPVTSVDPASSYQVASNADGEGTHLLITGNLASGVVATIHVPDRRGAAAYVATVNQVADRGSFALLDPATYQVAITAQ